MNPTARGLGTRLQQGEAAKDLADRLRPIGEPERLSSLDHCLDVLIAEVRTKGGTVDDLRLGMLAGPRAWPRLIAGTIAGVSGTSPARAGPLGRGGGGFHATKPKTGLAALQERRAAQKQQGGDQ